MNDAENVCRAIYTETGRFYEEIKPLMGDLAFGYKIMYGPPVMTPRVLFLGYSQVDLPKMTAENGLWVPMMAGRRR